MSTILYMESIMKDFLFLGSLLRLRSCIDNTRWRLICDDPNLCRQSSKVQMSFFPGSSSPLEQDYWLVQAIERFSNKLLFCFGVVYKWRHAILGNFRLPSPTTIKFFQYWSFSTIVTKFLTPIPSKTVTSFMDCPFAIQLNGSSFFHSSVVQLWRHSPHVATGL